MNYSSVTNPTWANAEHSLITCNVNFDAIGDESEAIPFTASPNDVEAHGREIYQRCVAGEFGPVAAYVAPPPPPAPPQKTLAELQAQLNDLAEQIAAMK
jgi:hypothetical protein